MTIKHVTVLGLGKVGSLVAGLCQLSGFDVVGLDSAPDAQASFATKQVNVSDAAQLKEHLSHTDAVISCLPYHLNIGVADIAHALGVHYFDLTEDVPTTQHILDLSKTSRAVMAPQCGLAPGFIGIVGAHLTKQFDDLRSIELRVGALPQHPSGDLGYAFNWSPEGVVNEYLNDCEVIRNGKRTMVPAMQDLETIVIKGMTLEAFTTSGGLGTMCETYDGKVDQLNYKTMRYPGHMRLMRFFFHELLMKNRRQDAGEILVNANPPVNEDVVYVHAVVEGHKSSVLERQEFVRSYYPKEIEGKNWRAISWTTAASIVAVVHMVSSGALSNKGFIKQEDIDLEAFLATPTGGFYKG
tara:strand:+ start:231 stop:1292 length:1062 start_codon:yes stop_codon:yes gene_type:complete